MSTPASIVVDPGIVDKVLKGFLNLQGKTGKERKREREREIQRMLERGLLKEGGQRKIDIMNTLYNFSKKKKKI